MKLWDDNLRSRPHRTIDQVNTWKQYSNDNRPPRMFLAPYRYIALDSYLVCIISIERKPCMFHTVPSVGHDPTLPHWLFRVCSRKIATMMKFEREDLSGWKIKPQSIS